MSKKDGAYDHITPELVSQVKGIIADSVKHNYSVSAIYGAHNAVFKRKDKPQTCGSCLRNRVRELKRWLVEYEKEVHVFVDLANGKDGNGKATIVPQYSDPDVPGFVLPAPGIKRIYMAEGLPFDITPDPEDETKGTAVYADGTKIKAGTYKAAHGVDIAVQPGGKITIKKIDEEEDLT